ncbi:MAG: hypothetical protein JJU34_04870 [Lunatimonas sp.]|uniref:hypothetical protein n=1 Tax=Lunatimonas sp. TaxID=2060141 RepID=UPI00263A91F6|nr:hypothetical protein [Lunatimonas sp.]MCC5936592.1 hypothetical protein [Lunatimonas sp.]
MKYLLFFYFCLLIGPAIAQSHDIYKPKNILKLEGPMGILNGTLLAVNDSSITVLNHRLPNAEPLVIPYKEINTIKIRKKNNVAKGLWIGMAVGGASGYIITRATYDPENLLVHIMAPKSAVSTGWTIVGIVGGGLLGTLIGSIKVQIPIDRHYPSFAAATEKLQSYTQSK